MDERREEGEWTETYLIHNEMCEWVSRIWKEKGLGSVKYYILVKKWVKSG